MISLEDVGAAPTMLLVAAETVTDTEDELVLDPAEEEPFDAVLEPVEFSSSAVCDVLLAAEAEVSVIVDEVDAGSSRF